MTTENKILNAVKEIVDAENKRRDVEKLSCFLLKKQKQLLEKILPETRNMEDIEKAANLIEKALHANCQELQEFRDSKTNHEAELRAVRNDAEKTAKSLEIARRDLKKAEIEIRQLSTDSHNTDRAFVQKRLDLL